MSRDSKTLTPTPFTAADADPAAIDTHQARQVSTWLWPGLALLLALAAAVIFWLPGQLVDENKQASGPDTAAPVAVKPATPAQPVPAPRPETTLESPWSEAQQGRLRQAAQEALDALLQRQFELEERGAADWAAAEWTAALGLAREGDALYQTRDFTAAEARYREAEAALKQLEESIPGRLEEALARGEAALQDLDTAAAAQALTTVELIEPVHPQLAALQARAAQLDTLRELMQQARSRESEGELAEAQALFRQAVETDPEHRAASAGLARVSAALAEAEFQRAMSRGYTALDDGQYDAARNAFREAAKYRPDSPEVAAARSELAAVATTARLKRLAQEATALEQAGDWTAAVARYREALEADSSLVFAQEGLARAAPRAELDSDLRALLDDPGRLATPAVSREAQALLQRAREIADPGPVLRAQREQLAEQLALATTPIPVTLRSDGLTEVTVLRVSRLGSFTEETLSLRPGSYTAVGSRDGYRDVREDFTVAHEGPDVSVYVACSEPI